MRILIVANDAKTCRFVSRGPAEPGHDVVASDDGETGLPPTARGSIMLRAL